MDINDINVISYPVFKLPDKPNVDNNVMYYYSEIEKEGSTLGKLLIIDDKNIDKPTLAQRRLQLSNMQTPLYRLKYATFFLGDLIKLATSSTYFIDSNGKLFIYKKSTNAKLNFYKVTKVIPINTGGAIIEVDGLPNRFKVLMTPSTDKLCAGILLVGKACILYGLYNTIPENTRRMV